MPQTFEDLTVEKEVAIRRRVAKECQANLSSLYILLNDNQVQ
jgi:hypothetical protein